MWHNNNDMVQRYRFCENEPIGYRNVCDTSSNANDEAPNRKLTFGIDRLLNMPTMAKRNEDICQSFFTPSHNNEVEVYHSSYETDICECYGKHEGGESFPNISKLSISECEATLNRIIPANNVCEPILSKCMVRGVQPLEECSDYVSLGYPVDGDRRCSKSIRRPFPLRIGNGNLGQNVFSLHHEAELITFQHPTTTPSFVESWHNDTGAHCSAMNECSMHKEQYTSLNVNKQRSNAGVPIFVKAGTQAMISRRKRSWSRAVFSSLQRKGLEKTFQEQKYITKPDRKRLAATLGLHDVQVKVWFQNRRMKWRHMVKNASIFSPSQNKFDQPSQPISSSFKSSDMPEMLANNEDTEDDVIID